MLILTGFLYIPVFSQNLDTKKLNIFFDSLENNNLAMGSFAIAKNGTVIYTRSIGYSIINSNEKVKASQETLYRIGSATKMFTATMIFQLIDEGKISLNTTLDTYFPQIPGAGKITVDMLLRHRSGLFDYVNGHPNSDWIKKPQTRDTIIDEIAKGQPRFLPNADFSYCNSGYYLLTCIIESITGKQYNENLQERICSKLQLKNTSSPSGNEPAGNEASGYKSTDSGWIKITDNYFPNIVGLGDILSTPADLITFVDELLNGKLISSKSLSIMKDFNDNNGFGRGIMRIQYFKKANGFGHRGDTFGTHTFVSEIIGNPLTFASCLNGTVLQPKELNIELLKICYDKK